MGLEKHLPQSHWSRIDPDEPSLNPGYLSTMTWRPSAAVHQAKKMLKTPIFESLVHFILEKSISDKDEKTLDIFRTFIKERIDRFKEVGITLHPASFLLRDNQIHGLATLHDGQILFISFFRQNASPLKGIFQIGWDFGTEDSLQIQLSPFDLANLRIFLEKIGPVFSPVAPWGPGIGLGNRMSILDYPVGYEVARRYGLCAAAIQGSVFREMAPERIFHRRSPPLIDFAGIGFVPVGHTGNSIQGQFLAGMFHRIKNGIDLPIVADADHIPVKGTSSNAAREVRMLIEEAKDRTLFTLDPHFCLYGGRPTIQANQRVLEKMFQRFPCERQMELLERYEGKEFQIEYLSGKGYFSIRMTREEVVDSAVRFEKAIEGIAMTWDMIETARTGRLYRVEVSIDEAPGITEPHHFFYLASELASRGLKPFSLAPGLGFTKRDVDIEGSKEPFKERVRQLASIAHKFGAVLGIHSGDGKGFATRKILAEATNGRFWYKISPDRQRNLFKVLSRFPAGSSERTLYEDLFDWTLCYVLRLALEAQGETARTAKEAIEEILVQETVTANNLRVKFEEALRCVKGGKSPQLLVAEMERMVRSPSSDIRRDPDSRIIHDYAFIYVGRRATDGSFLHRGRFFAISEVAAEAFLEEDRAYLHEMLEALNLIQAG